MTTEEVITDILRREGGGTFTDLRADRGGPTRWGVTQATLTLHRGHPVTAEDVKTMPEAEARDIYTKLYVKPFDFITDDKVRGLVVDSAVNHGVAGATRLLQKALRVGVDGEVGSGTRAAYVAADSKGLYMKVCAERVRHYGRIITINPSQAVFAAGWANRVAEFIEAA